MKKIASFFIVLLVAGCAAPVGKAVINSQYNPITANRLYAAEASYKVANDGALIYLSLRQCRKSEATAPLANRCRTYSSSLALQAASRKVNAAFVAARKCMRDTPNTVDCVTGVEAAVSAYSNSVVATGVTQ